ncbi:DUF5325 family protein [Bacillaceae bacterium Marseille-Q3522]|nr:DUF5325 family protein [Bacillaceae bacterium Marseille-Q3522]
MKQIKWNFLLLAAAAVAAIMGIGISIAERSVTGAIASFAVFLVMMGAGFSTKKAQRK